MKPGVLSDYILKKSNQFLIEITSDINSILILKSVTDGFNLKLCSIFSGTGDLPKYDGNCPSKTSNEKNVSIHYKSEELEKSCKEVKQNNKCFLLLIIEGSLSQKVTLGYTYNDHAFKLLPETIINGPKLLKLTGKINFVMNLDKNKAFSLYFNSKGLNLDIYSRIISQEEQ